MAEITEKHSYLVVFYGKIEEYGKVKSVNSALPLDHYQPEGGLAIGIT